MTKGYRFLDENKEHLHTLDGKPLHGGSTVTKVSSGEYLIWWALQQALGVLGYMPSRRRVGKVYVTNPKAERLSVAARFLENMPKEAKEYLPLLEKAYRAHKTEKDRTADLGTEMHKALEGYVKYCLAETGGKPIPPVVDNPSDPVSFFASWSVSNVRRFLYSEVHCYSRKMWTGGISDIAWEDMHGRYVLGDFKSSREARIQHFWQDAGYDLMLSERKAGYDANGKKVFTLDRPFSAYAVIPFGMDPTDVVVMDDIQSAKEGFKACLTLHKLIQSFIV